MPKLRQLHQHQMTAFSEVTPASKRQQNMIASQSDRLALIADFQPLQEALLPQIDNFL